MPKVGVGARKKGTREEDRSSQELEANALTQMQIVEACIEVACM